MSLSEGMSYSTDLAVLLPPLSLSLANHTLPLMRVYTHTQNLSLSLSLSLSYLYVVPTSMPHPTGRGVLRWVEMYAVADQPCRVLAWHCLDGPEVGTHNKIDCVVRGNQNLFERYLEIDLSFTLFKQFPNCFPILTKPYLKLFKHPYVGERRPSIKAMS